MDVERLQKINRLAQELMSHGMAADMNEAVKQADDMISSRQEVSQVMDIKSSETASVEQKENDNDMKLALRKLNYQLSEQNKVIAELKGNLQILADEVTALRNRKVPAPVIEKPKEEPQTQLRQQSAQSSAEKNKEAGSHARTGGYSPDDVSIEKYFYSGPPK